MRKFEPTITHHPDEKLPVHVSLPGREALHRFSDAKFADEEIEKFSPEYPYTTRVTATVAELRKILGPITEVATRRERNPALSVVGIRTLTDGTMSMIATDQHVILRGKLNAAVLGEPFDVTIKTVEARLILSLLGDAPSPVEHCRDCVESGVSDLCEREDDDSRPVTFDIRPGNIQVTVGRHLRTFVIVGPFEPEAYRSQLDPMIDELRKPTAIHDRDYCADTDLLPSGAGLAIVPRESKDRSARWGVITLSNNFDGVLMPFTQIEVK